VNLAISDIISFVFLPLMLIQSYVPLNEGHLADFLCKFLISFHVPATATFVSILTLTVLSVERYHAVVKPMNIRIRLRRDTVRYAVVVIWLSGTLLTVPLYVFAVYNEDLLICVSHVLQNGTTFNIYKISLMVIIVFIPFFIISFCYFQIVRELYLKNKVGPQNIAAQEEALNKRKLVKLSLSITLVFALFFFPLFVALIFKVIDKKGFTFDQYYQISAVLFFSEAGVNPFVYTFRSKNFRQAFKNILKRPFAA
jgi:hypothetical protein